MSSDNRGHSSSSTNVNNQVISTQTSKPTFAKVYANTFRPKREHAIIIDSKEGLPNDDYLDGLEMLIALSEVRGISKISGGRVCIYVTSAEWVTDLKQKKVQPGRSHIVSFRRQFYISEEDEVKLPETLQIVHDDITYWTYLSTDSTTCFICKGTGHIARNCTQTNESSASGDNSPGILDSRNEVPTNNNESCSQTHDPFQEQPEPQGNQTNKRALSFTTSQDTATDSQTEPMLKSQPPCTRARGRGRAHKKAKTEEPQDCEKFVEESLLPAKNAFDGTQNPTQSYDDFCQKIIKTHASTDLINDVRHHEPNQILDMIEKVYPLLAS
ncbi:hypothetical protein QAD02_012530 [Eretmocerus hayati]|uniref:Uncharacterized protein n=1 Tax=Eretmocerus hayati TaxID=131215 RepID=A0ACC2P0V1_9HYME|nr:hypothetical protein QAD02_012530 [Eretmocerus hayati]